MKGPSKFSKGMSSQYQLALIKNIRKRMKRFGIMSYFPTPHGWIINGKYISHAQRLREAKLKAAKKYSKKQYYPTDLEVQENMKQLRIKGYYNN